MNNLFKNYTAKDITFALYGLFLGDGSYSSGTIRVDHTNKQRFYVEWLEKMLHAMGVDVTTRYDYTKTTTFGECLYSGLRIKVPHRFYFESQHKCFDDGGKKIISQYVMDNINELGLLLWFLDDGQWHVSFKDGSAKRFGYLNTQSFTYEENVIIRDMFKRRFDIDLRIHTDNSGFVRQGDVVYYRLYFNADNFRKFYDIVRPFLDYIPEQFYYKFNMQYRPNRLSNSAEYANKYNLGA